MPESTVHSQWLFPISALSCTPTAQDRSLHEEMYDRSRGIEFLYRLGCSIGLFVPLQPTFSPFSSCLTLVSQPFSRSIHRSHLVPSLLHAVFDARLSSAGSFSHPCRFPPSCHQYGRVRKEAQRRS